MVGALFAGNIDSLSEEELCGMVSPDPCSALPTAPPSSVNPARVCSRGFLLI